MQYETKSNKVEEESLTVAYDGWIKKIVRRMFNKFKGYHSYDDLLSIAYIASVEAERTYSPSRAKFSAYIKPRIEGAIIRAVSNLSNKQHGKLREIYKFIDGYVAKHNMIPAQHIILKHVDITEKKFINLLETTSQITEVSLEDAEEQESGSLDLDTVAEYQKVMEIVDKLPKYKRDRIMSFLDDPTIEQDDIQDIVEDIRKILNI